ncbi:MULTISPECIES: ATP-binding cassette domain-containing protein [unclassified Chelatococcus]|uniref:ABC transporter ATP-binding protein n=1 Tax=unclassified Chelatococcus TaxID=2638111 RepID=UPI001BCA9793|nr:MULTISPECIES: ATP-binding cassette domain-containing protein [unclassified Chelatococcus]MBS7699735.1 ATP-binding cassette domain-containing protein [Chelatococcus sp. YT9]MBX3557067.1 ATP-binding cassette domain-containing protein [Chelatococcus sp.]
MNDVLLDVKSLSKRFGGVVALRSIDLTQHRGETLGMIGPNGSGKTTFVNCITGHLKPNAGRVGFDGHAMTAKKPFELAQVGLTRTYQAVRIFGELTVADNIAIAMVDAADPVSPERYAELADWLRIAHRFETQAGSLSLDEQRRLELMMRLVQQPKLIMLDEPVGGLSSSEVRAMIALLAELKSRCTVFIIEHTMKVIRELADKVVVLLAGEKLAEGPPAQILADQRVIDRYLGGADA